MTRYTQEQLNQVISNLKFGASLSMNKNRANMFSISKEVIKQYGDLRKNETWQKALEAELPKLVEDISISDIEADNAHYSKILSSPTEADKAQQELTAYISEQADEVAPETTTRRPLVLTTCTYVGDAIVTAQTVFETPECWDADYRWLSCELPQADDMHNSESTLTARQLLEAEVINLDSSYDVSAYSYNGLLEIRNNLIDRQKLASTDNSEPAPTVNGEYPSSPLTCHVLMSFNDYPRASADEMEECFISKPQHNSEPTPVNNVISFRKPAPRRVQRRANRFFSMLAAA